MIAMPMEIILSKDEEKLVVALRQLKNTSDALKAKETDGLEDGDLADLYEDIDLVIEHIESM